MPDKDEIDLLPETCWTCEQRIGEECGIDGHEVYEDTKACDNYQKREE